MIRLGVTGGIGSGKSTICQVFQLFGVPVYYADARAKMLIENDQELVEGIKKLLGAESYQDGKYNSSFVATKVFNNKELLSELNGLVHPAVRNDWKKWTLTKSQSKLLIKEAAIMHAADEDPLLDKVLYVFASEKTRISRVSSRDAYRSKDDIQNIIAKQKSEKSYRSIADLILNNEGDELVIPQVIEILEKLRITS